MSPATWPRAHRRDARLLVISNEGAHDGVVPDLVREISPADIVVVNDASTLPALLRGKTARGAFVEARLAAHAEGAVSFRAILFGEGDTRIKTEDRPPPPRVVRGEVLDFGSVVARVTQIDPDHSRLVTLAFEGSREHVVREIFRVGVPIQYAYVEAPLPLYHVQSVFASEPWSFEPASAGLVLDWQTLSRLRDRGTAVTSITHAAGISSTGDPSIDALLPFAEKTRVTPETADLVRARKRAGGRVIAIGTTVTRALETAATGDAQIIRTFEGMTSLRLGASHTLRVVDAILTGVHVPGESHHELLTAFQPREVLIRACARAEALGFLTHEWGDTMLVRRARSNDRAAANGRLDMPRRRAMI